MTGEELLRRWPLKVRWPKLTGTYHMLMWYTYDEKEHIIMAATEAEMVRVYERVRKNGPKNRSWCWMQAEPKRCWYGTVVSLPREQQLKYAGSCYAAFKRAIISYVHEEVRQAYEHKVPVPENAAVRCSNYVIDLKQTGRTIEDLDEYQRAEHLYCKNCDSGFNLVMPRGEIVRRFESLYRKQRDAWQPDEKGGLSIAPEADPTKPIFSVQHSGFDGVPQVVEGWTAETYYGSMPTFFFQGETRPVPTRLREEYEARVAAEKAREVKERVDADQRYKARNHAEEQRLAELMTYFTKEDVG